MSCFPDRISRKASGTVFCTHKRNPDKNPFVRRFNLLRCHPSACRKLWSRTVLYPNAIPYLNLINKDYGAPCKNDRSASMDVDTKMRAYACIKIISDRQIDITCGYKVWRAIGQALANEFGPEEGRRLFHLVSQWHSDYYPTECDRLFDWCIANHDFINISTFSTYLIME